MESLPEAAARVAALTNRSLVGFLARTRPEFAEIDPCVGELYDDLTRFVLSGGKRLRPAFLYWGHLACGGEESEPLLAVASGLELLHAFALVHDDIMDGSDLRRGQPTVHRAHEAARRQRRPGGDPVLHGISAAILLGDLAFTLADRAIQESGFGAERLGPAFAVFTVLRQEVLAGQYLDLLGGERTEADGALALRIARFKTGRYSVERPLQMGAVLAAGAASLVEGLSAYGLPLGEAFQLRDDILGATGDPAVTGKPTGDDFRQGKHTYLVAEARLRGSAGQRRRLTALLGSADLGGEGVAEIRGILEDSGALAATEARIKSLLAESLARLDGLPVEPATAAALGDLARYVARRAR